MKRSLKCTILFLFLIFGFLGVGFHPETVWASGKYPVKWDLSSLVDSEETWQANCEQAREICEQIASLRGSLKDADAIIALRTWNQKFEKVAEPLLLYVQLAYSLDPSNAEVLQHRAEIYQIIQEYQIASAYVEPEIYALPLEVRQKIFRDRRLLPYADYYKQYTTPGYQALPEVVQRIIQPYQIAAQQFEDIYDVLSYVEIPAPVFIFPNGEEVVLDASTYSAIIQQDFNRKLKLAANKTFAQKYGGFCHTYAAIYQGKVAATWADAQLYGYPSTRSYAMAQEHIPELAYLLMQQTVHGSLDQLQEFLQLHREGLGEEVQYAFDLQRDCSDYQVSFTYDEAVDRVRDALSVLGVEYIQAYNQLVTSGHIDVYPAANKNTGSYTTQSIRNGEDQMGYMMLNFQGSEEDVSTLAHESGHALYGWFSQQEQPAEYRNPTVFTHEVASTTNELLYYMYAIDHAETLQERLFYLEKGLKLFYGTLFIQTLYAEFEDFAYETVESGQVLDANTLDQKWNELYHTYRGEEVQVPAGLKGQWAQIPHFFESDFYVYKYACDICYASVLAQQIYAGDDEALVQYRQFLMQGSSADPTELLASAGVDILDPSTYQAALNLFVQWKDQYASIIHSQNQ